MPLFNGALQNLGNNISNTWQSSGLGQAAINAQNNVTSTVQNVSNNISNAWQNSAVGQAAIALQNKLDKIIEEKKTEFKLSFIAPFRPLMVNALRKKGITIKRSDSLLKVLFMFEDAVILNKNNIDYSNYKNLETDAENAVIGTAASAAAAAAASQGAPIPAPVIDKAIRTVMNFIQNITHKKANNEQLTPDEQAIVTDVQNVDLNTAVNEGSDWSPMLKVITFAIGIYVVYRVFFKK